MYQSSKTVKNSQKTVKTEIMTIGVPIVTGQPRLYQRIRGASCDDALYKLTFTFTTVYQSSKTVKTAQK